MHNYGIGGNYDIHCYKHDSTIYKYWEEAIFLEENDDYVVFANRNTKVIENDGIRLDKYLMNVLDISRSRVQNKINEDKVLVNGKVVRVSYVVKIDDVIEKII